MAVVFYLDANFLKRLRKGLGRNNNLLMGKAQKLFRNSK
jgi:hypothetical protein